MKSWRQTPLSAKPPLGDEDPNANPPSPPRWPVKIGIVNLASVPADPSLLLYNKKGFPPFGRVKALKQREDPQRVVRGRDVL